MTGQTALQPMLEWNSCKFIPESCIDKTANITLQTRQLKTSVSVLHTSVSVLHTSVSVLHTSVSML